MVSDVLILDGGIGHLLKSRGVEKLCTGLKFEQLFAAGSLANGVCPEVVEQVHQDYLNSGADIITTNTFGCTSWSLGRIGKQDEALSLAAAGARIAQDMAHSFHQAVRVAGCLPPLKESYEASDRIDFELMQPEYQSLATTLAPHVDIFLCETMSSIPEALAAATAASGMENKPWWVSFTLEDNEKALLRSGEPLGDAVRAIAALPGLEAVLVNCCAPQAVTAAIPVLKEAAPAGVLVGGYANGFSKTTSEWLGEGGSRVGEDVLNLPPDEYDSEGIILPEAYARHARLWVEAGAGIVGGCCGIGPQHIAKLAELKREQP